MQTKQWLKRKHGKNLKQEQKGRSGMHRTRDS